MRAAYVHGGAQKFLSDHDQQQQRPQHLRAAIAVLKPSVAAAAQFMGDLSAAQGSQSKEQKQANAGMSQLDALADLYVDSLLLLLDCAEGLSAILKEGGSEDAAELEQCQGLAQTCLTQLGVQ